MLQVTIIVSSYSKLSVSDAIVAPFDCERMDYVSVFCSPHCMVYKECSMLKVARGHAVVQHDCEYISRWHSANLFHFTFWMGGRWGEVV